MDKDGQAAVGTTVSWDAVMRGQQVLHEAGRVSGVLGTGLPGLGTEHLPGALCSGTGSPALGLCSL